MGFAHRGERKTPSFPGSFCRGARDVPRWRFQGDPGQRSPLSSWACPPSPGTPPGCCGKWVRGAGPALPPVRGGSNEVPAALPGAVAVPPPRHPGQGGDGLVPVGCSYLTVITNCGGNPSPFSARPRGRRRRFSGGLAANNSSAASAHYLRGAARTCSGWENLGQWVSQAVP